jgi:carbon monoxide dehydrogenase subunit G
LRLASEEVIVLGKVTVSIEIEASPEKVFDFVISDKMYDLYKEYTEGKWTSAGPVGVGSTAHYVGVHKRNKGEEWNAEVTEFTKDKSLTMFLKGANKHSNDQTNYFAFEPTSKGTKVTFTMEYKMSYLIDALVAKRMIEREDTKILENLKKTLEA